jgi:hypothetical protein
VLALGIFGLYLLGQAFAGWHRFTEHFWWTLAGAFVIALIVGGSYLEGIIPPLPLSLRDVGVYHSVNRTEEGYVVEQEVSQNTSPATRLMAFATDFLAYTPWQKTEVVHIVPGDSLSVFSSVFAPTSFSTAIIHKWEWYNPQTKKWQMLAEIAFSIEGGRDGGYRGYSTLPNSVPGKYRVFIETLSGQVIGETNFIVEDVSTEPQFQSETY